ncbi:unnamed protein product [Dovyalis caffra]|uniref:Plastocyanin-like domain-containing protein n=1 Tax=Dovyalis caffra TaxID=77055 RepID=A0AAV1RKC0_9ROSI|nr:unnamed protein product [Dovyalis caffra]
MTDRPYVTGQGTSDNSTVAGILEYEVSHKSIQSSHSRYTKKLLLYQPNSPSLNDTSFATNFTSKLRSLASAEFPANVPQKVDRQYFFTVGLGTHPTIASNGTKLVVLPVNAAVELILQGTSMLGAENHPFRLHGFNFLVVGQGFGNFNPNKDSASFNLIDPIERNTVGVPSGG